MYPILLNSIDLHGCLSIYGLGCIAGSIFILLVLKETSGECLDDVGHKPNTKIEIVPEKKLSIC